MTAAHEYLKNYCDYALHGAVALGWRLKYREYWGREAAKFVSAGGTEGALQLADVAKGVSSAPFTNMNILVGRSPLPLVGSANFAH